MRIRDLVEGFCRVSAYRGIGIAQELGEGRDGGRCVCPEGAYVAYDHPTQSVLWIRGSLREQWDSGAANFSQDPQPAVRKGEVRVTEEVSEAWEGGARLFAEAYKGLAGFSASPVLGVGIMKTHYQGKLKHRTRRLRYLF